MKKKTIIILIVIVLILLIPIPMRLKDGGTIEFRSLLYKISKVHRLETDSKTGYADGIIIEILGIQVYYDVVVEKDVDVLVYETDNISMAIKEGTLTKTGVTVVITDLSGEDNIYGEEFVIERRENFEWREVIKVREDYGFNSIGYKIDKGHKLELEQNWEYMYGELEKGRYRLVKYALPTDKEGTIELADRKYFSVEFKIS